MPSNTHLVDEYVVFLSNLQSDPEFIPFNQFNCLILALTFAHIQSNFFDANIKVFYYVNSSFNHYSISVTIYAKELSSLLMIKCQEAD